MIRLDRAIQFKALRRRGAKRVPGLVAKIYLGFRETGEIGAMHLWDSEESFATFRDSVLARSISDAYQRVGAAYRDNYSRLADIEARYGPDNLFDVNQNIRPASGAGPRPGPPLRPIRGVQW